MNASPLSLPHSGGQWMVTPVSTDLPSCQDCVALSADMKAAEASGDGTAVILVRARIVRHFANWHVPDREEREALAGWLALSSTPPTPRACASPSWSTPTAPPTFRLPRPPAGPVTADALTPAWSPSLYDTPAFRRSLAELVSQRLREEQDRLDALETWGAALERLGSYVLPRTSRGAPRTPASPSDADRPSPPGGVPGGEAGPRRPSGRRWSRHRPDGCTTARRHEDGPGADAVKVRKEPVEMGKKNEDEWDPQENQDTATDPDTRLSQNGDVWSSAADDEDRERK